MERGDDQLAERAVSMVSWLVLAWAAMLVVGVATLVLGKPLGAGNPVSAFRAVFTAVSCSTLTGFPQSFAQTGDFSQMARLVFFFQTLSGALLCLVGGGLLVGRLVHSAHSERAIATAALVLIGFSILFGMAMVTPGEDLIAAASRGLGALSGSAIAFGTPRAVDDPIIHAIFLPLSLIGGAGTIVVLDLVRSILQRARLSSHALSVLAILAGGYLISALLIGVCVGSVSKLAILRCSALAIAGQGYGLTYEPVSQLRGVSWVLMAIMLSGVGTLSTAGGWGLAWFATVPRERWATAVIGIVGVFAIVFFSVFALTFTDPQVPAHKVLLLSVASVTNTGIAPEPITMPDRGLLVLSVVMLAGRLLPLLLISQALLGRLPKKLEPIVAPPLPIVDNPSKARRRIGEKGEAR